METESLQQQQQQQQQQPPPPLPSQANHPMTQEDKQNAHRVVSSVYWCKIPVDSRIEDPDSFAGRHFRAAAKIGANNCKSTVYWGRTVENPDLVVCFLCKDIYGLDTMEAHVTAQQEAWRWAASKLLLKVCTEYPLIWHVEFPELPLETLEAPITLIGSAFFGAGAESAKARAQFEDLMSRFDEMTAEGKHARPGAPKQYRGWAVEDDIPYTSFDGPVRKGKALYILSGWESVEANVQFYTSEGMEEETASMVMGGSDGWRLIHIPFQKIEPDSV